MFDVWVPDGAGPFPVYIYAHGGGFTGGSKKRLVLAGPLLANDDVVFVNINYRLHGATAAADSIDDAVALINYLKANSAKYKINPDQIFVGGGSAGGVIFNEIVYGERVTDIKGLWNWNVFAAIGQSLATQAAYSDPAVLANFPIPVVHGHPLPTPHPEKGVIANPNPHDPDYAFEHVNNNWAAGNPSMFYKATKEHPSQIGYKTENQNESEQSLTPTPDNKIKQIWIDGVWYLDYDEESGWVQDPTALNPEEWWATGDPTINDSVDMPNLAEWIYEIIGNNDPDSPDYAAWKTEHEITDDLADDDYDGVVNRLEFALGGNPNTRDAQSLLPTISRNGNSAELHFFRGQTSLDYIVKSSVDLEHWESFITVDDSHGLVGSSATVLVPDSQAENGRLFLQLIVEDAATQPLH